MLNLICIQLCITNTDTQFCEYISVGTVFSPAEFTCAILDPNKSLQNSHRWCHMHPLQHKRNTAYLCHCQTTCLWFRNWTVNRYLGRHYASYELSGSVLLIFIGSSELPKWISTGSRCLYSLMCWWMMKPGWTRPLTHVKESWLLGFSQSNIQLLYLVPCHLSLVWCWPILFAGVWHNFSVAALDAFTYLHVF